MGYIARTDNGSSILEIREGVLTDIDEAERTNWRTVVQQPVTIDTLTESRGEPVFTVNEPNVDLTWSLYAVPGPWAKFNLKAYAAQLRWQKTQGGITLQNGVMIDTTDASQTKITQTYLILKEGWVSSIDFKSKSGWISVDLAAITAVAQAVAGFVQTCFTSEKAIAQAIDAGTITSKDDIDSYPWY